MKSLILQTASRVMLPLLLFFAIFLLLRGHHLPGGGFSGALVASSAYMLFAIAHGREAALARLRTDPQRLIGAGLCVVLAAGLAGVAADLPFLTGLWLSMELPWGRLDVGTPLLFDAGVFLAVTGVALSILLSLLEA